MSIRSLARELGVSPTAISLPLQNSPRVSVELREQVVRAAKASGHVPNAQLAALMSEVRRSGAPVYRASIGIVSLFPEERPWIERPLYSHLRLVYESARQRAESHGYKTEALWVKRPGLNTARLRSIIEARGIRGLLCLGSLDPEERFPPELMKFTIVTFAASIPDRLHRVMSNFAADGRTLFDELLRRGYTRPGLVILNSGDRRTDHLYSATFLSHQERRFRPPAVPILRAEQWNEPELEAWYNQHRPDVIVLHQYETYTEQMMAWLAHKRIAVPRDLGVALLDKNPDRARFSGICQDPGRQGAVATEMLLGRLLLRDFGLPESPKVELVLGSWNEGASLRRVPS
jgi:LacI family transcriptional regulator